MSTYGFGGGYGDALIKQRLNRPPQKSPPGGIGAPPTRGESNRASGGGAFFGGSNPYYDQLASLYRAQGAAEAAAIRSAIQQMLIGFGLVPEGFTDKLGALDPVTRTLIEKNTKTGISTYARLEEAKRDALKNLVNRLTARGLRRSGTRGYQMRRAQLDFDRNLADAISALLRDIGGMYSSYTANELARQAALMQAAMTYGLNSWSFGGGGGGGGGSASSAQQAYLSPQARAQLAARSQSTTYDSSYRDPRYGTWMY